MRTKAILAGLVTLVMVLSAMALLPATPAKASSAAQDSTRTLYLAMQQDVPDFNAWNLASNSVWKANVINWGFEALAGIDYDMLPYPLLAESWDFYENNLTVIIHLREGVLFHDGTPLTAEDVVFMYHAAREGATYSSNIINAFDGDESGDVSLTEIQDGVQYVNDNTVKMVMAVPYGQFFTSTLGVPIMPKHIWEDHLTGGATVEAGGVLDTLWSDPDATISTGPFYYKEGAQGSYRIMEKFTDYWGKDFKTPFRSSEFPNGFPTYPPNVDTLFYKIYANLDTAILALQSGAVDHIMWAVTAGRVPGLQADPNIGLEYLTDNGYFYLAFNQKLEPMNSLPFRKAVSHLIDKNQIVNVYMGGFGSPGTACEPPFWGEWHNASVETWPYDDPFDTSSSIPEDLLDEAGFADANNDGWRDMPDGTPMEKIIILTPPADYDPIRIRAGQMIAKNMRAVQINAEAKAIEFDTLVARLQGMDYQMLIIGWSLTSDPVGNVFDILGPLSNSNTFGWWSDALPNPFYSDLLGVNTRADAESQALADFMNELAKRARGTFNIAEQIENTTWGQGVVADAIPCNPLYYRVNIHAYSKAWSGWIPFLGELVGPGVNIFCLSNLVRGAGAGATPGATESVNAGMTLQGKVVEGESVDGYVLAIDSNGDPVSGAAVQLTVEGVAGPDSVSVTPTTGTTDATGRLDFSVSGEALGYSYVNVTVSSAGIVSEDSAVIKVIPTVPPSLYLGMMPDNPVLMPGEDCVVALTVTDESGMPVEGAVVSVDPNLIGYGDVDVESVTTDADGYAEMVYTAPSVIVQQNAHLTLTLSFAVSKAGYSWTSPGAVNLLVYNDAAPDWRLTWIDSVTTTSLDPGANTTSITVQMTDDEGLVALADEKLDVVYSNESWFVDPVMSVITDGSGFATVDVQVKDMGMSGALRVTLGNTTVLNATSATVTLTYYDSAAAPDETMVGGYIQYSAEFLDPMGALTADIYLWDHMGAPYEGNASLVVSGTPYGSLTWCDDVAWDSTWDYLGINIVTAADDQNIVTSGPFNTSYYYDDWESNLAIEWLLWDPYELMGGIQVTGGQYSVEIYGVDVSAVGLIGDIFVVPGGIGWLNFDTVLYEIDGQTIISSDYVIGRSFDVVTPVFEVGKGVLTALVSGFDSSMVDVWVTDEMGDPAEGAWVEVYENGMLGNSNYAVVPYLDAGRRWTAPVAADADGYASATVLAIGRGDVVPPASLTPDLYVKASEYGAISIFGQTMLIIHVKDSVLSLDGIPEVQAVGSMVSVTAWVMDASGDPVVGMPVELTAGVGSVVAPTLATDTEGKVVFTIDTSSISGVPAAFIPLQAKAAGPGYDFSLAKMMVAAQNTGPSISVVIPGEDEEVVGVNVTVAGSVYDANGLQLVTMSVDGGADVPLTGTAGDLVWEISSVVSDLDEGSHTITVSATDMLAVTSEYTVTFSTVPPEAADGDGDGGADMLAWGLAIVGWVIAVIAIVMMLMRKPKGPSEMAPGKPEVEPETEEEVPPIEKV